MMPRSLRVLAVALVACLLAAACGQKEGVHVTLSETAGQPGAPQGAADGAELAPEGSASESDIAVAESDPFADATASESAVTDSSGAPGMTGGSGGGSGSTGAATGAAAGQASGGSQSSGQAAAQPSGGGQGQTSGSPGQQTQPSGGEQPPPSGQPASGQRPPEGQQQTAAAPGDSTGITDTTIKIGGHAPLTGAAPIPQQSFVTGKDMYWRHYGGPYDREVEVIIEDDQYNPSRATSVCNKMIQRDEVFLLLGAGGADQIAACARTAAQQGVPYLSAGVDEGVLRRLRNYFAFSMSYVQQADLLVNYINVHARPSNNRIAIVRDRTPSFNAALTRFQQLAEQQGYEVHVRQTQNGPSDGQWLLQREIETAFPLMAPSQWVQIVNSPGGDIRNWVGVGITMGLNSVASAACPRMGRAMFFSPYPGINQAQRLAPDFYAAGGEDDIQFGLWGISRVIDEVFEKMNGELTREAWVRALETNAIETGLFPVMRHTPDNHFGTNTVHVLRANCARREYETADDELFVSRF